MTYTLDRVIVRIRLKAEGSQNQNFHDVYFFHPDEGVGVPTINTSVLEQANKMQIVQSTIYWVCVVKYYRCIIGSITNINPN